MAGYCDPNPDPAQLARSARGLYGRYVNAVCQKPWVALGALLLLCAPALVLSVQFFSNLRAGLQELLPKGAPIVRALDEIHERLGGQAHVTVIAQSPDAQANRRFISLLGERLEQLHLKEVRSIQVKVTEERKWVKGRSLLLMSSADFDALIGELESGERAAKLKANPLYVDLSEDEKAAPKPQVQWDKLRQRLKEETRGRDRFPNDYLETPGGETVVLVLWLQGSEVEMEPATRLMEAVEREVANLKPQFPSTLTVAYNGEVPNLLEEHAAILADLSASTLLVVVLVGALIVAYFRSLRAVLTVVLTLVPGLLCTFALGRLTVGSLNSNTAFLGSIIAGNGINYPLLLLAYYRAQPREMPLGAALLTGGRQALPGTLGAAATASAAYAGLAVSHFRGFSQFGWLGGLGMLTVWVMTFAALPIFVALLKPPRRESSSTAIQRRLLEFFQRRRLSLLLSGLFVGLSLLGTCLGMYRAKQAGLYEMDIQALRNRDSLIHGAASWDARMNELFGVWLNPVVALARNPSDREPTARELKRVLTQGDPPAIERAETIETYVPPLEEQEKRLARIRRAEKLVKRLPREEIPEELRGYIDAWLAKENLTPIRVEEVPLALKKAFTEVGGRTDRVVLLYPSLKINYNDGNNILRFADQLSQAQLPKDVVVGGGFLFMAEIIRLVRDEALSVVALVCLLVSLALVPIFFRRPSRILVSVLTVFAVAISSQAIMMALGIRVNMLNFAAVPITIGVGADYAVNLFGAMQALRTDARQACARMGGAILLCSLTTVIGYLSLVLAQSGALRTFGWSAVLGEVMAVTTVLLVLPVVAGVIRPWQAQETCA